MSGLEAVLYAEVSENRRYPVGLILTVPTPVTTSVPTRAILLTVIALEVAYPVAAKFVVVAAVVVELSKIAVEDAIIPFLNQTIVEVEFGANVPHVSGVNQLPTLPDAEIVAQENIPAFQLSAWFAPLHCERPAPKVLVLDAFVA